MCPLYSCWAVSRQPLAYWSGKKKPSHWILVLKKRKTKRRKQNELCSGLGRWICSEAAEQRPRPHESKPHRETCRAHYTSCPPWKFGGGLGRRRRVWGKLEREKKTHCCLSLFTLLPFAEGSRRISCCVTRLQSGSFSSGPSKIVLHTSTVIFFSFEKSKNLVICLSCFVHRFYSTRIFLFI